MDGDVGGSTWRRSLMTSIGTKRTHATASAPKPAVKSVIRRTSEGVHVLAQHRRLRTTTLVHKLELLHVRKILMCGSLPCTASSIKFTCQEWIASAESRRA